MINNFIPFLSHHHGNWITSLYSVEAIAAISENTWDANKECVISAYNNQFEYAAEEDPALTSTILLYQDNSVNTRNTSLDPVMRHIPPTL